MDPSRWFPKAQEGLRIDAVDDGYIVRRPGVDRVHFLNHTAAIVLEMCNGQNAASALPELLRLAYTLSSAPTQEVQECLAEFQKEKLID